MVSISEPKSYPARSGILSFSSTEASDAELTTTTDFDALAFCHNSKNMLVVLNNQVGEPCLICFRVPPRKFSSGNLPAVVGKCVVDFPLHSHLERKTGAVQDLDERLMS